MQIIDVGLIFEDIKTADKFLIKHTPEAQKVWQDGDCTFRFTFLKAGTESFKGQRYHFVFTTEDVMNSEWYRQVGAKLAAGGSEVLCREDGTIIGDSKKGNERDD